MSTIQEIVAAVQTVVGGITGIRQAPAEPPDSMAAFPFAVCMPHRGHYQQDTPGCGIAGEHIIRLEIHTGRKNARTDYLAIIPYVDSVPAALLANTDLSGTVYVNEAITYEFGPLTWNGLPTIGWRFDLHFRTRAALT